METTDVGPAARCVGDHPDLENATRPSLTQLSLILSPIRVRSGRLVGGRRSVSERV